ncbi:glycerophosphoryl diester phosphodiesterase membrane domain-containing protein, partial [Gleimia europaea]|nr:glycerophosphoryl diester phosphodiesterase membrane domain-containing protein [Gleimia europaea]
LITAVSIGIPLLFIDPGLSSLVLFLGISVVLQIAFYLIAIRFMFAFPIILIEGQKMRSALSRSWKLTRERFWPLLGTSLLMGLALLAITIAFSMIFGVISGLVIVFESTKLLALITSISTALIYLLIAPLTVYALTLMYVDTRIRKEGYDIELARSGQAEAL